MGIGNKLAGSPVRFPLSYTGGDLGCATKGAGTTLLGKAYMQNKRWADASAQFALVIGAGTYRLTNTHTDNFRHPSVNNSESIFEVQLLDVNKRGNVLLADPTPRRRRTESARSSGGTKLGLQRRRASALNRT